jgi:lipopolysaccharide/colanic/teichoic acid biosynthesis glycosyltransferase
MSFVGPRALMPEEIEVRPKAFKARGAAHAVRGVSFEVQGSRLIVEDIGEMMPLEKIPGYEERHRVRPGLTGLAQIYADRDIPRRCKFKYDLLYIRKQSFWLDLKLIALSFWITFRGKWEHRGKKF